MALERETNPGSPAGSLGTLVSEATRVAVRPRSRVVERVP